MSNSEYSDFEDRFGEVMSLLRSGLPPEPSKPPDEGIWEAVTHELGLPVGPTKRTVRAATVTGEFEPDLSAPIDPNVDADQNVLDDQSNRPLPVNGSNVVAGLPPIHLDDDSLHDGALDDESLDEVILGDSTPEDAPIGDTAPGDVSIGDPRSVEEPMPEVRRLDSAPSLRKPPVKSGGPSRWVLAAACFLLVAVPGAAIVFGNSSSAEATLLALEGYSGNGSAVLDGRTLSIDIDTESAPEGSFYELWLLDLDEADQPQDLVSLGMVEAGGEYEVPDNVDLSRFKVVDVSLEPDDGDETHSGASVVRGTLDDA